MNFPIPIPGDIGNASLRKARQDDIREVWLLANDPDVRSASFISEPIPWEEHCKWFRRKIESRNDLFLILEVDGLFGGQVRYEKDRDVAWVNFSVSRAMRGRGFGTAMLVTSMETACSSLVLAKISAAVKHDNIASIQCFRKAGLTGHLGNVRGRSCLIFERSFAMPPSFINLEDRRVGSENKVFIVAELSANHGQSLEKAKKIICEAARCGADAIKIQTYTPDTMTLDMKTSPFIIDKGSIWEGKNLYDLYGEAFTPWEWHSALKDEAEKQGLLFFSTPFDSTAVDFLENLAVGFYKVASFEIVDIPLLRKIAATGKPVIVSTGMASLSEIEEALDALRKGGCDQIALLKCTSAYPAPPEEMNLRTIPHLSEAFGVPVGLSDHTTGIAAAITAVTLGACIIEKHFTLSRSDQGPDSSFSMEPVEFKTMVRAIHETEKLLGRVSYALTEREIASKVFRRSLFVVENIKAGEPFTPKNVRCIRPYHGLHPRHLPEVLKHHAAMDIPKGTPLSWKMIGVHQV